MKNVQIIRVPILPFHMVNAHLVIGSGGAILVDTGLPGTESAIQPLLSRHGISMSDIKLIVITHAHVDHAGNAARLRELTGAPIVGHQSDLPHFTGELPMSYCPTGLPGRLFLKTSIPHEKYTPFHPDILLCDDEVLNLSPYGVAGTIEHSGGHTPGSLSLRLETEEALVGDLVASGILIGGMLRLGRAIRPPFEDDPEGVARALNRLLDAGTKRFYLGHGGPLGADAVARHAKKLANLSDD